MSTKRKITRLLLDGEPEPEFDILDGFDRELVIRALNYYARNCDYNKSKEFLLEWVEYNAPEHLSNVAKASIYDIKNTGFVARMLTRGLVDNSTEKKVLDEISSYQTEVKEENKVVRVRQKNVEPNLVLESFDYAIDAITTNTEVLPLVASTNKSHLDEVQLKATAILNEVSEFPEQYTYVATLKRFLKSTIDQMSNLVVVAKKERTKKVKPKRIDPIKMVSKLVLGKEDASLGVKGLQPSKIIGASKLLVWHPERRVLTVFISSDPNGFIVSGKSVKNYDIEKSISKKIRKPEVMYDAIKDLTMTRAHYWLRDDCKTTESPAKAMIADGSIIIKLQ